MPRYLSVPDAAPPPVSARYSHAVEAQGLLFVTGQLPIDPANPGAALPEGIEAQTELVFRNLTIIAEAAGYHLPERSSPDLSHRFRGGLRRAQCGLSPPLRQCRGHAGTHHRGLWRSSAVARRWKSTSSSLPAEPGGTAGPETETEKPAGTALPGCRSGLPVRRATAPGRDRRSGRRDARCRSTGGHSPASRRWPAGRQPTAGCGWWLRDEWPAIGHPRYWPGGRTVSGCR